MTEIHYLACGLGALLLGMLIWRETKRTNRNMLVLRILASVVAIPAFVLLFVPLTYESTGAKAVNEIILLTPGYNSDSVRAFTRNSKLERPIFVSSAEMIEARVYMPDIISTSAAANKTVHVFGRGLRSQDAAALKANHFILHDHQLNGITGIAWQQQINSGNKLSVTGAYHNNTANAVKLCLASFGTTQDSTLVAARSTAAFSLHATPKQLGKTMYRLSAIAKNDTLENNPVPVVVNQHTLPALLIIAASPDFETKFLKNWLAENGYPVRATTSTSKGKYNKETLNTVTSNTGAGFEWADLVIADAAGIAALSGNERSNLQTLISRKGKGLLVRTDSTRSLFFSSLFPITRVDSARTGLKLQLPDSAAPLAVLQASNTAAIRLTEQTRALLQTAGGAVYAASARYGAGKIAATTISNSFSWLLSGSTASYSNMWSALLHEIMPAEEQPENWYVATALPSVNEPVTISLEAMQARPPVAQLNSRTITMTQDINFPFRWTGTYWPEHAGWQTGIQLNGSPWYWYAYDRRDWANAKSEQTGQEMRTISSGSSAENKTIITATEKKTVPKLLFFILFLLPMAFLWLENKFYDR